MTFNVDKPAIGNAISADIPDIEENFAVLGPYATIWVPAEAMTPLVSNGAEAGVNEYATNDIMMNYLAFDCATQEHAAFSLPMPENWNRLTILAKFFWVPTTGCTAADDVIWGIEVGVISNDDAIDADFDASAQTVTDAVTAGVEADLHITGTTGAITVAGTPALGDLVHFKVYRDADAAGDTMDAEDAWLFGVWIQYMVSEETAVWS